MTTPATETLVSQETLARGKARRIDLWIIVTLVAGTLLLFARTGNYDFVNLDDGPYAYDNPHVMSGLSIDNVIWAFKAGAPSYWHPTTWLSLMLDVQLFGKTAGPMHIHNVVLHAANSALLFFLLLRLTGARWPSAWVAAMFAWHPLHVESVAWVTERKDVLSGLFFLLCLISYTYYVRRKSVRLFMLVAAALLLGVMAKPMLVTVPAVLLLLDFWPICRFAGPHDLDFKARLFSIIREKLPLLAIVVACAVVTLLVQSSIHSIGKMPWQLRFSNMVVSYVWYLWLTLIPKGLAIFYPHPVTLPNAFIPAWETAISIVVLVTITIIALRYYQRVPALLMGWLWYLGTLIPVIGLVQSGSQSHADRFTYIPLIGIFISVAWCVSAVIERRAMLQKIAAVAAIVTVLSSTALSWRQIGFWRNTNTVMQRAIDVVPNNFVAHRSIGQMYDQAGNVPAAAAEYLEVLRIKPNDMFAYHHLALHASNEGRIDDAAKLFRMAVVSDDNNAEDCNNYGNMLMKQGRVDDAITVYRLGIKRDSGIKETYHNLALALGEQGKFAEAIPLWKQALKIDPNYTDAHAALGTALLMAGSTREGIAELRSALKLDPERTDALNSLAWTLATHPNPIYQDGVEAERLADSAVEITQGLLPIPLDTLGAAQARSGRFDDAFKSAERAVQLAQQKDQPELVKQIKHRLEIYRAGKPYTLGD